MGRTAWRGVENAQVLRVAVQSTAMTYPSRELRPEGTPSTPHSTGKERDAETGLDSFGARYYSGAQGRFTSSDEFTGGIVDPFTGQQVGQPGPLPYADITDPQTLNKYVYVRNNPLRYIDPDGHDFWDYVKRAINAFTSDDTAGGGRIDGGNGDFQRGQAIGDAVATITGTLEALGGGAETIVTSPAAATGVGVLVPASGAAVAAHGTVTATVAGGHLANAAFSSSKPSLSDHKEALGKVHAEVGKQPKGEPVKFGGPQAGNKKTGYRLDPAHPNAKQGTPETQTHFNWWDFTKGKRNKGAVPVGKPEGSQ
ncbi:RHS repeat-associated core domain-containing protein [Paludibaculum fermentans]|uniref:RHS repeat-associated core domain-containing protein n=1 Tax=Paludibaculum fermentans TaxID=1473598 RepID=UPI003EBE9D36